MTIRNKVLVQFHLEDGCSQDDDEVGISWQPINFMIYSPLFIELIEVACDEWLAANELDKDCIYEVIFANEVEHDGGGAVHTEYFTPISDERRVL